MSFVSLNTLLFISLVIAINALLPKTKRYYWLLASSICFVFLLSWQSALVLVTLSSLNFLIAKKITSSSNLHYLGVFINISAIIGFNYIGYYNKNLSLTIKEIHFSINEFVLAIGLSFYSIQHIAYLIDLKKGRLSPETNYLKFLFCSTFFPKFISGPITKHSEILVFTENNELSKPLFFTGFNRFLMGLSKKLVIADSLAPSIHSVFDFNNDYPGLTVFAGGLLFTIQLYFDFSGYTDMAIGVSNMLGITLPENFNMPLRASSIGEFWRKWHMSLIRFFTEYIFYPVTYHFRKKKKLAAALGIIITFTISGIWHGLGITFIIWAICHLSYLLLELVFIKRKGDFSLFRKFLGWIYVIIAVSFSNIFFRIKSTELLLIKCKNLFSLHDFFPKDMATDFFAPLAVGWHQIEQFNFAVVLFFSFCFLIFERKLNTLSKKSEYSILYTYALIMLIIVFGVFSNGEQFIYMQF